jgi:hypothetical protein
VLQRIVWLALGGEKKSDFIFKARGAGIKLERLLKGLNSAVNIAGRLESRSSLCPV